MVICSVDLSMSTTGLSIYDTNVNNIIFYSKISTKYGKISKCSEIEKVIYVVDSVLDIAKKYNTDVLVAEDIFIGYVTSKKTAILLAKLRGALEYACNKNKIEFDSISNSNIKKTICSIANIKTNSKSKEDVALAVNTIFSDNSYVQEIGPYCDKQTKSKTSDIYDAIALAVVYKHVHKL